MKPLKVDFENLKCKIIPGLLLDIEMNNHPIKCEITHYQITGIPIIPVFRMTCVLPALLFFFLLSNFAFSLIRGSSLFYTPPLRPNLLPTASRYVSSPSTREEPQFHPPSTNTTSVSLPEKPSEPIVDRLVTIKEESYTEIHNWNFSFPDYEEKMVNILKSLNTTALQYNIDASFKQPRYFVIPNIKGLCNRLQLLAGLYILSSYYHIPIIFSSSMGWRRYWDLRENFPGQFIELPDRGMLFYTDLNEILMNATLIRFSYPTTLSCHPTTATNYLEINQCLMKGILYYTHTSWLTNPVSKTNALFRTLFMHDDINAMFQNYKYCGVIGNVPFIRFFHGSNHLSHFLVQQGIAKPEVINASRIDFTLLTQGAILKHILQPTQLVLSAMQSIFPDYRNQSFIGIHLRTGGLLSDVFDYTWYLSQNDVDQAISFMKSQQQANPSLSVFLSSDSSKVKNSAIQTLNTSRLIINNERVVIVDTQLGTSGQSDQLLSAIAELMILGYSQSCYGTSESTFSLVGCGFNGKTPWLIGRYTNVFAPIPLSYRYI